MPGWARRVLISSLLYAGIVVALWLGFGLVSGVLNGKRFFDDDVGAAFAVVLIPATTIAATLGFAVAYGVLAFHWHETFPVSLRAIALSVVGSIVALVALHFLLAGAVQLGSTAVRNWGNDHFLAMEFTLASVAGALGFVVAIAIPGRWAR